MAIKALKYMLLSKVPGSHALTSDHLQFCVKWFDQTNLAGDAKPAGRGDQPGLWEACPQVTRDFVTLRQKKKSNNQI